MMLDWSIEASLPLHILLTKADKLKRGAQQKTLATVARALPATASVQIFSSTNKIGKEKLIRRISDWTGDWISTG